MPVLLTGMIQEPHLQTKCRRSTDISLLSINMKSTSLLGYLRLKISGALQTSGDGEIILNLARR
ncbi:hypothetical protein IE4872_PD01790 (plasmid) [Rhizobium gallicum]|uniref:Uncharacterized protein n=1 Tax=Rhizobium gallicum TaxID=56730 RepID=A0A1L5NWQ3_9HYPH|nr:hypothetical protein IE4872_PD01790 [Rhizobium gallicum]